MTDLGALGNQGGAVIDVTDATFEQEVMLRSQSTPVVVDLWAPWCGPCKTLGPILEELVGATDGRVVLAKVNVDENPAIAGAFQVQSIPAVYAVSEAKVVDGFMGAVGRAEVEAFIDRLSPSAEDDMVAALVAARPLAACPVRKILAYETVSETEWAPPHSDAPFFPTCFIDISEHLEKKLEAMACFESQVKQPPDARSLRTLEALARVRGATIARDAAEAFVLIREIV